MPRPRARSLPLCKPRGPVQAEGTCWAGASVWQGHTVMRISVSSWATTDADVERSLEAIIRVAAQITDGV